VESHLCKDTIEGSFAKGQRWVSNTLWSRLEMGTIEQSKKVDEPFPSETGTSIEPAYRTDFKT
jgi:hypothetical protein